MLPVDGSVFICLADTTRWFCWEVFSTMSRLKRTGRPTCGALCDEAAWPEACLRQGLLHNLQRHPVLDAASRVQHLRLCQDLQHRRRAKSAPAINRVQQAICSASRPLTLPQSFSISTLARICSTGDQKGLPLYTCKRQCAMPLCPSDSARFQYSCVDQDSAAQQAQFFPQGRSIALVLTVNATSIAFPLPASV